MAYNNGFRVVLRVPWNPCFTNRLILYKLYSKKHTVDCVTLLLTLIFLAGGAEDSRTSSSRFHVESQSTVPVPHV